MAEQQRQFMPPTNGTEERLDAVLDELRSLRKLMEPPSAGLAADGTVELREPAVKRKRSR